MADINVDWKKTALLVIDMQNDFILPGGPMYIPMGASVVPAVKEAVAFAREKGALVVWVVREHDKYGRDVELFRRHLYGEGKEKPTTKGTKGADLVEGLVIQEGDYKLVKTRFSAFFATHLHSLLQGAGITSVVVVGVQTPNCIRQTVFDAVALDYNPVIVLSDATAAKTPEVHSVICQSRDIFFRSCLAVLNTMAWKDHTGARVEGKILEPKNSILSYSMEAIQGLRICGMKSLLLTPCFVILEIL